MRIVWDERCCASLGMCEEVAPETFEVGDDGKLRVLVTEPPESERDLIAEAVRACPTGALSVEHRTPEH